MRKMQKLRRRAVILGAMIIGMFVGKFGTDWVVLAVSLLVILWLMAYDFAEHDYKATVRKYD